MSDRNELVTITLPNQRMYRERQEDRTALTVGPGEVTVPRWVADAWGIAVPEAPQDPEPKPDPVPDVPIQEIPIIAEPATEEAQPVDEAPKRKGKK
jgi:hypothetical protein